MINMILIVFVRYTEILSCCSKCVEKWRSDIGGRLPLSWESDPPCIFPQRIRSTVVLLFREGITKDLPSDK